MYYMKRGGVLYPPEYNNTGTRVGQRADRVQVESLTEGGHNAQHYDTSAECARALAVH